MQRYFVPPQQMEECTCFIEGQDAHHVSRVMRLQTGDEVICCNGIGRSVQAIIKDISKDRVECEILREVDQNRELSIFVTIAQGLPKGDKLEWVIQKGTELGAHRFIPFSSSRTIVKYDVKKEHKKVERWEKIIKEAAEQSHRSVLPRIEAVSSWKELLKVEADCKLVAYEDASLQALEVLDNSDTSTTSSFAQALSQLKQGDHLLVVIGPEGGLEEVEVAQLQEKGFQPISLGKRILRTETASQYVLSAVSFYFEQMGG
jgi:16S rRNA (uracil1498-N3)-methyltransferase